LVLTRGSRGSYVRTLEGAGRNSVPVRAAQKPTRSAATV
jgi:hypothetical protein